MYINMTPDKTNKTLHASQDDTTRQFKFKLVNDSQVLDTSDSIPPVIYDVEPNGIEQLLPVNSSTPTTSPIIADIQYPDELREDQEFVERITPTTLKGQAKVKKIKGNTLVFNQLVRNGNLENTGDWGQGGGRSTLTVENNIGTATLVNSLSTTYQNYRPVELVQGHKILIHYEFKLPRATARVFGCENNNTASAYVFGEMSNVSANIWHTVNAIHTVQLGGEESIAICYIRTNIDGYQLGDQYQFKNLMVIDLTQMFGSGNEPTSIDDFTSLFPLPYYDYNAGSLLSFNGSGIKTTGKNLAQNDNATNQNRGSFSYTSETLQSVKCTKTANGGLFYFKLKARLKANTVYKLSVGDANVNGSTQVNFYIYSDVLWGNTIYTGNVRSNSFRSLSFTEDYGDAVIGLYVSGAPGIDIEVNDIMLTFEDTDTSVFEPYIENTIDLPISTFFPTGMKSAGTVYDELTPTKAIARVGSVDLGTLDYVYDSTVPRFYTTGLANVVKKPSTSDIKGNAISDMYEVLTVNQFFSQAKDKTMMVATNGNMSFINTAYSSASAFKSAMSGVYLYYELATPTEEEIESYSLVSEDIEKPLEYDSGYLVCDSEGLTSKSGFIPCKVKKTKGDETLYSQLINLHVERRP